MSSLNPLPNLSIQALMMTISRASFRSRILGYSFIMTNMMGASVCVCVCERGADILKGEEQYSSTFMTEGGLREGLLVLWLLLLLPSRAHSAVICLGRRREINWDEGCYMRASQSTTIYERR